MRLETRLHLLLLPTVHAVSGIFRRRISGEYWDMIKRIAMEKESLEVA